MGDTTLATGDQLEGYAGRATGTDSAGRWTDLMEPREYLARFVPCQRL